MALWIGDRNDRVRVERGLVLGQQSGVRLGACVAGDASGLQQLHAPDQLFACHSRKVFHAARR
jgi:hypothetical protein